jgi:hypothetical protein
MDFRPTTIEELGWLVDRRPPKDPQLRRRPRRKVR